MQHWMLGLLSEIYVGVRQQNHALTAPRGFPLEQITQQTHTEKE